MSLAEYLAKNYLTADPASVPERPKKKRKKAKADPEAGLIIADDDPPDLRTATAAGKDDDEDGPVVTGTRSAEFRRAKTSGWKSVSGSTGAAGTGEKDAADAILASAAAERRDAGVDEDAGPTIEGAEEEEDGGLRMETGVRAGLQTAEQTAAMVAAQERRRKAEAALFKKKPDADESQETIYRDASGRIINVAMKRAEARKAEQAQRDKEEAAREALMGDVQRQDRDARKQQLEDAKAMPLARTVEDETMNEDLKAQQRWADPAAEFLSKPAAGSGVSGTGKPLYRGSFQPNRYGIRPGHRWDGVDRANGFEKEWFASRNKKGRIESLEYQWQMDE